VLKVRWRRFRFDDDDEPLRYAPRTLTVIKTMKGLRHEMSKTEGKSWYDNNWFVFL
jgi:hypothetical protein